MKKDLQINYTKHFGNSYALLTNAAYVQHINDERSSTPNLHLYDLAEIEQLAKQVKEWYAAGRGVMKAVVNDNYGFRAAIKGNLNKQQKIFFIMTAHKNGINENFVSGTKKNKKPVVFRWAEGARELDARVFEQSEEQSDKDMIRHLKKENPGRKIIILQHNEEQ